ncbi:glycosyl transferase [Reticulomyxa filosa]|uniref:GDP-Man:Man(3)GlcNAc(2)-PP-Dol alpha-1,2-mannosyltransferase n=1 Tax=Reticulomyxa filosa TaxID=46433 RepID=X6NCJ0_RETFI|nr:glycosyl transferase [Reticulomyxa filosa]|eukprot:ETO23037.1 glycosyl transferase [Reticulomyxa filosa]
MGFFTFLFLVGLALAFPRCYFWILQTIVKEKTTTTKKKPLKTIAFLHPHCEGGGGGERVLWEAIHELLLNRHKLSIEKIIIYGAASNDKRLSKSISYEDKCTLMLKQTLDKVKSRFNIDIDANTQAHLKIIPIYWYWIIDAKYHPFATLFTQSFCAMFLMLEALFIRSKTSDLPHCVIDTTGLPFTYPFIRWCFSKQTCKIMSYVHYPVISSDMISRVSHGTQMYNNQTIYTRYKPLKLLKLWYYDIFAMLYGLCGFCFVDCVMVNSSWTKDHIVQLWGNCVARLLAFLHLPKTLWRSQRQQQVELVYPPCDVSELSSDNSDSAQRKPWVLSVGQFRPEKNHLLQIDSFQLFLEKLAKSKTSQSKWQPKLIMVGGVRNDEDKSRVAELQKKIEEKGLQHAIEIQVNLEWNKLCQLFQESFVGLHTMRDEHFGICVVEYMLAGLVVLAHCSAGPLMDIVGNGARENTTRLKTERGFLCSTVDEYADTLVDIFEKFDNGNGWKQMKTTAKTYAINYFSNTAFRVKFRTCVGKTLKAK